MNKIVIGLAGLLIPMLAAGPAAAWSHANYHGGTTSHTAGSGSTTRTDAAGGSETHTYGQGTTASTAYGGSAYHKEGSGQTTATGAYGGTRDAHRRPGHDRDRRVRRLRVSRRGLGLHDLHERLRCDGVSQPLLRRGVSCVSPADHGELLRVGLLQLRRLEHGRRRGSGRGGRHGSRRGRGFGEHRCGDVECVRRRRRGGERQHGQRLQRGRGRGSDRCRGRGRRRACRRHGVCDGRHLRRAACRIHLRFPRTARTYYLNGNTWFQPSYGANGVYYRVVPTP